MTKLDEAREDLRRAMKGAERVGRQYGDSQTGRLDAWKREKDLEEASRAVGSDIISWIRLMTKKLRRYR